MKNISKCFVLTGVISFGVCLNAFATVEQKPAAAKLTGQIIIDGSSTVYPVSEAVAEAFGSVAENKSVQVKVAQSGTGGGFQKFCRAETDISGASRPIKESEKDLCAKNGVKFIELPIAYDGIAIVVNKKNSSIKSITTADLKRIWEPNSSVKVWGDIGPAFAQNKNLKNEKIKLYGPGPEHGTFDYFTETIVGKEKSIRSDFSAINPDVIVTAVKGDPNALAYFGFAYYYENRDKLGLLAVDGGKGPVLPSATTIADGTYQPLSRPIFIYVSEKATNRPEVSAFVNFYIKNVPELASQVGYVPLPKKVNDLVGSRFQKKITGSIYETSKPGSKLSLQQLLSQRGKP
ncbi:MAG: phosphate transporter periplasmic phosphate-binding protein [Bacteriovoracaceae bacterium]|nr:phosphate transporter periplasmic phosphate-binding protein [Bacteriovoracaceae bacterium]